MSKPVTLIAKAYVTYGGRGYGVNMQFVASAEDAKRFIESGEAAPAPVKKVPVVAPAEPVAELEAPRARRSAKE